jgi:hypothetical protein
VKRRVKKRRVKKSEEERRRVKTFSSPERWRSFRIFA